jgi:hypothetical protein
MDTSIGFLTNRRSEVVNSRARSTFLWICKSVGPPGGYHLRRHTRIKTNIVTTAARETRQARQPNIMNVLDLLHQSYIRRCGTTYHKANRVIHSSPFFRPFLFRPFSCLADKCNWVSYKIQKNSSQSFLNIWGVMWPLRNHRSTQTAWNG